ncbi:MAG: ATP-binding protein [Pseudomonadota bacterium]
MTGHSPRTLTIALCVLAMTVVVAIHATGVWRGYHQRIAQETSLARATARALAEQVQETLRLVDAGLTDIAGRAAGRDFADPATGATIHAALVDWQLRSTATLAIWLTDATGTLRLSSSDAAPPPADFGHRRAIREALKGASGLVIGDSVIGTARLAKDRPIINLARAIVAGDGTVEGVVAATLSIDQIEATHRTIPLPADSAITTIAPHGTILTRTPWDPSYLGMNVRDAPLLAELASDAPQGTFRAVYPSDGVERIGAFDTIEPHGVTILVGLATAEVLRPWWKSLAWTSTHVALILAAIGGLTATALKSFGGSERALVDRERRQRIIAAVSERLIGASSLPTLGDILTSGVESLVPGARASVLWGQGALPAPATTTVLPLESDEHKVRGELRLAFADGRPLTAEDEAVVDQLARVATTTLRKLDLLEERRRALEGELRSRRALAASHAEIEAIFASISDAVISLDREWRFTYLNPKASELLRRTVDELLGQNVWTAFPAARETPLQRVCEDAKQSGEAGGVEFYYAPLASWFAARVFPRSDGLTIYFRDVTDRIHADAELRQAQKMDAIGQLTGGIAHDFNNLLTVILGNLEMLQESPDLAAEDRGSVDLAVRASEQAAQLTAQLLAFARRQPLDPRPVDVQELVDAWRAVLERTLGPGIGIETHVAPDLIPAQVDPVQLQNALLNLALNARDAMDGKGVLRIEVRERQVGAGSGIPAGRFVEIRVTDTGRGMTPEIRERAFDPFFTTKSQGRGSGLGLAMVYGFARQSGGHALLESTPGNGTTVTLLLPGARDAATSPARNASVRPAVGDETILLVEDNPDVGSWLRRALEGLGYTVIEAGEGTQALDLLRKNPNVALLLTDIGLPGDKNGLELAEAAIGARPGLRVLFASGNAAAALGAEAMLPPGARFLQKPIHLGDLARGVREALDAPLEP